MKTPVRKNNTVSQLFGNPKKGRIATKAPASMMSVSSVIVAIIQVLGDYHDKLSPCLAFFQSLESLVRCSGKQIFMQFG